MSGGMLIPPGPIRVLVATKPVGLSAKGWTGSRRWLEGQQIEGSIRSRA